MNEDPAITLANHIQGSHGPILISTLCSPPLYSSLILHCNPFCCEYLVIQFHAKTSPNSSYWMPPTIILNQTFSLKASSYDTWIIQNEKPINIVISDVSFFSKIHVPIISVLCLGIIHDLRGRSIIHDWWGRWENLGARLYRQEH